MGLAPLPDQAPLVTYGSTGYWDVPCGLAGVRPRPPDWLTFGLVGSWALSMCGARRSDAMLETAISNKWCLVRNVVLLFPGVVEAQTGQPIGDAAYDSAFFAWERGEYVDALTRLERLLRGANAARYLEPAALLTGELFATAELTTDGLVPRWSPDGQYVSFETGTREGRRTAIFAVRGGQVQRVATVEGSGLVFDGRGRAAYVAGAPARVVVRELASGRETTVPAAGLTPQAVTFRPGEDAVYVIAPTGPGASDLHRLEPANAVRVTKAEGTKTDPIWLAGDRLLYSIDRQ